MDGLPPDTQATLLLVNRLADGSGKPLTVAEYNRLAKELHEKGLRPADLLRAVPDLKTVDSERVRSLVSRGTALALCVERWTQTGVRLVARGEAAYPRQLKGNLRAAAAPILFYCGPLDLLNSEALCVVGSRDPTDAGLEFARSIGKACAEQDLTVVSGDARGVDREAIGACIAAGGRSIGVLAEALSAAVLSKRNRSAILEGRLLLLSPYDPDARFTVAQAMDRNRYLYALSCAAVIVDSDTKGGTWSGAIENLKNRWTPALARVGRETRAGNPRLVEMGLTALDEDTWRSISLRELIAGARQQFEAREVPRLPLAGETKSAPAAAEKDDAQTLFEVFIDRLKQFLATGPKTENAIAQNFGLELSQTRLWLTMLEPRHGLQRDATGWSSKRAVALPSRPAVH